MDEFLRNVETELELPDGRLEPSSRIKEVPEMDSMGLLSVITMVDAQYGVILKADDLAKCVTVGDIYQAMESRR